MHSYQVRELLPATFARNKAPSTVGDWLRVVRGGLPASSVESLLDALAISRVELCQALNIPERTLARRLKEGRLTPDESEKVLRLGRIWERAMAVFEAEPQAREWLKAGNAALENEAPLSLLDADIGAEAVLDLLGRIEHGVFS